MTEDEKQEAEAKKDIAEKGEDSQSEKDRIDESVGEQEHLDGNEDSQSAKDRVDESEGAKKADEESTGREEDSKGDALSERIISAINAAVESAVTRAVDAAMTKAFENMADRQPEEAETEEADKLRKLEGLYNY